MSRPRPPPSFSSTDPPFELPAIASETLGEPALQLQLHGISFSHYVERARWTLRLLGLPFEEVGGVLLCPPQPSAAAGSWVCATQGCAPHHTTKHHSPCVLPTPQVNHLPLLHMPSILALQRRFRQGPGRPTASSKSPAATPCLAVYTAAGQPLW
jgi:hypothetical protein